VKSLNTINLISLAFIVGGSRWEGEKNKGIKQIRFKVTGTDYWTRKSEKVSAVVSTVIYI
jgi:hypothetical protein